MENNFTDESSFLDNQYHFQKIFRFLGLCLGFIVFILFSLNISDLSLDTFSNLDLHRILEEITPEESLVNFLESVHTRTYKGSWKSEKELEFLSNRREGEIGIKIEKMTPMTILQFEAVMVLFRLLDGNYIDKWIIGRSMTKLGGESSLVTRDDGFSGNFSTDFQYGEMLELAEPPQSSKEYYLTLDCFSEVNLSWDSKNTSMVVDKLNITAEVDDYKSLTGSFKSPCGFEFIFEVTIEEPYSDYNQIMLYSIIVSVLALFQIFNTVYLTNKVGDSTSYANSISLITIAQNIIWNTYGCLCHFFLTVNYDIYAYQFGIPAFLYFINFSVFELRLLYNLWRVKYTRLVTDPGIIRRKLIQFYFVFYIVMFLSLFYVLKFYFDKKYIFLAILLTWFPQIIYNRIYRNKMLMPGICILAFSLNKLLIPMYFRGSPDNFFQFSYDFGFVILSVGSMIAQIALLYSLSIVTKSKLSEGFYKSKEEILALRSDADNIECVICLSGLFSHNFENFKYSQDDFIPVNEFDTNKHRRFAGILKAFIREMKDFNEYQYNVNRKDYMMTPCKHFFHSTCLESWFKQKKECPSCRQDVDEDLTGL